MRAKQREAFDLLTLQLVERGYVRMGPPPDWDGTSMVTPEIAARNRLARHSAIEALALHRQRDAAADLSRPGIWWPGYASVDISNDLGRGRKRWEVWVEAPSYKKEADPGGLDDCLGYKASAWSLDGNSRAWLDDGELIVWEGLDHAVQSAKDLAAWMDKAPEWLLQAA